MIELVSLPVFSSVRIDERGRRFQTLNQFFVRSAMDAGCSDIWTGSTSDRVTEGREALAGVPTENGRSFPVTAPIVTILPPSNHK
jgi:hypothetical protein